MLSFTATATLLLATSLPVILAQNVFVYDCTIYPDVCDNWANAHFCHGITGPLHLDSVSPDNVKNGRRNAVGCNTSRNYCSGTGGSCDEFPFASTFDGGLGCFPGNLPGFQNIAIAQSGTTLCVVPGQNSRHGNRLGTFYRQTLNNVNGTPYLIGFLNGNMGPLAPLVSANPLVCPDETSPSLFRFRSTPASINCPRRRALRGQENIWELRQLERRRLQSVTVTTQLGQRVVIPLADDSVGLVTQGAKVFLPDASTDEAAPEDWIVSIG